MPALRLIEAHRSLADVADAWRQLESACPSSGYQRYCWVEPWLRIVGRSYEPLILLARDEDGAPAALFPLIVSRRGPLAVASYAGAKDSNINLPLVRPEVNADAATLRRILDEGARAAGVDAYAFRNQPVEWAGRAHPLCALGGQPSPSLLHSTRLPESGEAFLDARPRDARKRTRWRMRKLCELGEVSFLRAQSPDEIGRVAAAFREQKKIRIAAMGADDFDADLIGDFLEAAALAGEPGAELHALMVGDRVAALYGGVVHQGRYSAMVNSFDTCPDIARSSPGELVTLSLLESLCDRGLTAFDLGVGEAAYKQRWCEVREPLFDTFHGVSAKGKAYALAASALRRTKRQVKQSAFLWPLARRARAVLRGRNG